MSRERLAQYWPLFGLKITTPKLQLRYQTDEDLVARIELQNLGIHDPATMPFGFPFTDTPLPRRDWETAKNEWQSRAEFTPEKWVIHFAAYVGEAFVGIQSLRTENFPTLKAVNSGSWIGRKFQGRGLGSEMRRAMLFFAFDTLAAERAESGAFHDNAASNRVSEKLGYKLNGTRLNMRRDQPDVVQQYVLTRDDWAAMPLHQGGDVVVEGFDACRGQFGL